MNVAPAPLVPAATVACLRDTPGGIEALLLLRNRTLSAFAGVWVFPGGKLEASDGAPGADEVEKSSHAAAREANEETGLVVDPSALGVFSLWIPPPAEKRRFKTWFFLADAGSQPVQVGESEILEHRWVRPRDVVAAMPDPDLRMMPPTFVTLCQIAEHGSVEAALHASRQVEPPRFETRMQPSGGGTTFYWRGDAGYESGDLNAAGARNRLVTDADGWRYQTENED